jgi:hypothetical protein
VLNNRELRKLLGPKMDEVSRDWKKFHSEQLEDLHFTTNIQVIKSRTIKWVGHMACMEQKRSMRVLVGKPKGREYLEN